MNPYQEPLVRMRSVQLVVVCSAAPAAQQVGFRAFSGITSQDPVGARHALALTVLAARKVNTCSWHTCSPACQEAVQKVVQVCQGSNTAEPPVYTCLDARLKAAVAMHSKQASILSASMAFWHLGAGTFHAPSHHILYFDSTGSTRVMLKLCIRVRDPCVQLLCLLPLSNIANGCYLVTAF